MSRIVMNIASIVLIARDPSFVNGSYILLSNNVSTSKFFPWHPFIHSDSYSTWQSSESSSPPSGRGARTGTNMTPRIQSQTRRSTPIKPTPTDSTLQRYRRPRYPHSILGMPEGEKNPILKWVRVRSLRAPNTGNRRRKKGDLMTTQSMWRARKKILHGLGRCHRRRSRPYEKVCSLVEICKLWTCTKRAGLVWICTDWWTWKMAESGSWGCVRVSKPAWGWGPGV